MKYLLILLLLFPAITFAQKSKTRDLPSVPLFSVKFHHKPRPDTIQGIITAVRRIKGNRKDRVITFEGYIVNGYAYDTCWNRMPMYYHVTSIKKQ